MGLPGTSSGAVRWGNLEKRNEAEKNRACGRIYPYGRNGLPPKPAATALVPSWECDEYPFASTLEGAGSWAWDFSVMWVPATQNNAAGQALKRYYFMDRILYGGTNRAALRPAEDPDLPVRPWDQFYVEIARY